MKIMLHCLCAVLVLLSASCARFYGATDPQYSQALNKSKPDHVGPYKSGIKGIYTYQAYQSSVHLKASTGVVRVYEVDVHDLDQNARFDTVFALYDGKWKFGSIKELRGNYHLIDSGLSQSIVMEFIRTATKIKRSHIVRKTIVPKAKIVILEKPGTKTVTTPGGQVYQFYLQE